MADGKAALSVAIIWESCSTDSGTSVTDVVGRRGRPSAKRESPSTPLWLAEALIEDRIDAIADIDGDSDSNDAYEGQRFQAGSNGCCVSKAEKPSEREYINDDRRESGSEGAYVKPYVASLHAELSARLSR